jgi:hypothetical protein
MRWLSVPVTAAIPSESTTYESDGALAWLASPVFDSQEIMARIGFPVNESTRRASNPLWSFL